MKYFFLIYYKLYKVVKKNLIKSLQKIKSLRKKRDLYKNNLIILIRRDVLES